MKVKVALGDRSLAPERRRCGASLSWNTLHVRVAVETDCFLLVCQCGS